MTIHRPVGDRTAAVRKLIEDLAEGDVFTLDQIAGCMPEYARRDVSNSISILCGNGLIRRVDGRRGVYQRTIIQPVVRPKGEDERIQDALGVLLPNGKVKISNLLAINAWVEATKKLLEEIR